METTRRPMFCTEREELSLSKSTNKISRWHGAKSGLASIAWISLTESWPPESGFKPNKLSPNYDTKVTLQTVTDDLGWSPLG